MKIKLSKIASLLLAAAVFAVPACTDYSSDIKEMKADIDSVKKSVSALETSTSDLKTQVSALQTTVDGQTKAISDLQTEVKALEASAGKSVEEFIATLKAINEKVTALEEASNTFKSQIASLTSSLEQKADKADVEKALQDAKAYTDAEVAKLQSQIDANTAAIAAANVKIAGIESEIEKIWAAIQQGGGSAEDLAARVKACEDEIVNIKNALITVGATIDELWDRLQSIAYVPQYTDGKADLNFVGYVGVIEKDGKKVAGWKNLNAQSKLVYKVTPAEQAAVIEKFYADKTLGVSLDLIKVQGRNDRTRAEEAAPALEIVSVKGNSVSGELTVTVLPKNFVPSEAPIVEEQAPTASIQKELTGYSAALVVNTYTEETETEIASGDRYITSYTNFVFNASLLEFAKHFAVVDPLTGRVDPKATMKAHAHMNPYNVTDVYTYGENVQALFKAYTESRTLIPAAQVDDLGVKYYTASQLQSAFGITLPVTYKFTARKIFPKEGATIDTTLFVRNKVDSSAKATFPEVTVQLKPDAKKTVLKTLVGSREGVLVTASVDSIATVTDELSFIVCRPKLVVKAYSDSIKWTLSGNGYIDVTGDRGGSYVYQREDGINVVLDSADVANLKEYGITLASFTPGQQPLKYSIVEYTGTKADTLDTEKTYVQNVAIKDGKLSYGFYNYKYGKNYAIDAIYSLDDALVEVVAAVKTIDRTRDTLFVTYPDTTFSISKFVPDHFDNPKLREAIKAQALKTNFVNKDNFQEFMNVAFATTYTSAPGTEVVKNAGYTILNEMATMGGQYAIYTGHNEYRVWLEQITKAGELLTSSTWTTCWGLVVRTSQKVTLENPAFDLKHNSYFVQKDEAGNYFSQAEPEYTPADGKQISAFDIKDIDMNQAFYFIDQNGKKIANPADSSLSATFNFKTTPKDKDNIKFNGNKLSYHGYDPTVAVTAKVKVSHFEIPSSFDTTGAYFTYYVKQFNPITTTVQDSTVKVTTLNRYVVDLRHVMMSKDNRGKELYYAKGEHRGDILQGDGKNGFDSSVNTKQVYGIDRLFAFFADDAEVADKISKAEGKTYLCCFTYDGEIELTKPVTVTYYMAVNHPWVKNVKQSDMSTAAACEKLVKEGLLYKGTITYGK